MTEAVEIQYKYSVLRLIRAAAKGYEGDEDAWDHLINENGSRNQMGSGTAWLTSSLTSSLKPMTMTTTARIRCTWLAVYLKPASVISIGRFGVFSNWSTNGPH